MMTPPELAWLRVVVDTVREAATASAQGVPAVEVIGTAGAKLVKLLPADVDRATSVKLLAFALLRFVDLRAVARDQQAESALATLTGAGRADQHPLAHARVA